MGNSSTKLAEKCPILAREEIPLVASSFKLVSKNSERIKEDDLMVSYYKNPSRSINLNETFFFSIFRNAGDLKWIHVWRST